MFLPFNSRILYLLPKAFYTRGTLLEPDYIKRLCSLKTLTAFVDELLKTEYEKYLREIDRVSGPEIVEYSLNARLIDYELLILKSIKGSSQEFIKKYFARHLYNLLGYIIRLKYTRQPVTREELAKKFDLRIEKFFEKRDIIDSLIAAKDFDESLKILKLKGYKDEVATIEKLQKLGFTGIYVVDLALDEGFYSRLLTCFEALNRGQRLMLKSIMRTFIEHYNVMLILRSILWKLPEELIRELLLYSGKLHSRLIIPKQKYALTLYLNAIRDILGKDITLGTVTPEVIKEIDFTFHKQIRKNAEHLYLEKLFSIAPIYASILLLEIEVLNLTKIAYGIWRKIEPQNIIETLIL